MACGRLIADTPRAMPFAGKPIVGIVGGIAAGKSFVARTLAELGCEVIDSDAVAHAVYADPAVIARVVARFGPGVLDAAGAVDRRALASRVFRDPADRAALEGLVHPLIHAHREGQMRQLANDPRVRAFVWDSPLLIEAGLHARCDAVLFVDTPRAERLRRAAASRGWDEMELARREASQLPLAEKRRLATHVVRGDAGRDAIAAELDALLASLKTASATT